MDLYCPVLLWEWKKGQREKKKSMYWEQKYLLTEQWSYDFKSRWAKPSIASWQ